MRVVFFGTPTFAVPTLERLIHHPDFSVIGVVTQPDKRRGRGSQMMPSAVKQIADLHQIPIWQPQRIKKEAEVLAQLSQAHADAFVVVAYGQILSRQILDMPKLGCINVHGSILPQYRGAAPIQWSLYNGDRKTGITTMLMNEGMDTGDMLLKEEITIGLLDNAEQIANKLSEIGADLLIKTLIEGNRGDLTPIPQEDSFATYAPLIAKDDFAIDWNKPALDIHNQVRGFYPHCQTLWETRSLKIRATIPLDALEGSELPVEFHPLIAANTIAKLGGEPGEIVNILKNWGAIVQTGQGNLLIKEVQLSGKRVQSGWDFVNGNHVTLGDKFS